MQAQYIPGYPNNYVTYRPALNLNPTFSDLDRNLYATPSYPYTNSYNQNDNNIRIWPYVVDQYTPYSYNNNNVNNVNNNNLPNYIDSLRPTLQSYTTTQNPWIFWNNQYIPQNYGKK